MDVLSRCLSECVDSVVNGKNNIFDICQSLNDQINSSGLERSVVLNYIFNFYINNIEDTNNTRQLLVLIDLATEIEESCGIQALATLLIYKIPAQQLPDLLDLILTDERILKLTKQNKLQGKIKPGSKLLTIYNNIKPRLSKLENLNVLFKLRSFVNDSFEINDKLSQSLNWHCFLNRNFSDFLNSNKYLNKRKIFDDYLEFNYLINNSSELNLIQAANKNINELSILNSLTRKLKTDYSRIPDTKFLSKSENLNNWILDYDVFEKQYSTNKMFYLSLRIQVLIILNFLKSMLFDNWKQLTEEVISEYSKFKKPDSLVNQITGVESKKRILEWYNYNINWFKTNDLHYDDLNDLFESNELTFTKMKLKSFTYPTISSLSEVCETNGTKRKLQEYTEKISQDEEFYGLNKKPKFVHGMGTPKLTKLWRNSTKEQTTSISSFNDILENAKDDIYYARGNEDKELEKRLKWKAMRASRECGSWFDLGAAV